jgi:pimeloyl-ACP methyl ester carboxylesterase
MKTKTNTKVPSLPSLVTRILPLVPALSCLLASTGARADRKAPARAGYKQVGALKMYYEIHGQGRPLVLLHGGGSTIGTSFGQVLGPLAAHRQVVAVELQAHGHTADVDRPLSFEQDADDVAGLLAQLQIKQADVLGFSNGGSTAMQMAIRHPALVRRLIVASSCYKRSAFPPQFWDGLARATLNDMPKPLRDAYLAIVPDPRRLAVMFERDRQRMLTFKDWQDDDLRAIKAPTLLIVADRDVVSPEHTVAMYRLLPQARLVIMPGAHGAYLGEVVAARKGSPLPLMSVRLFEEFLDAGLE